MPPKKQSVYATNNESPSKEDDSHLDSKSYYSHSYLDKLQIKLQQVQADMDKAEKESASTSREDINKLGQTINELKQEIIENDRSGSPTHALFDRLGMQRTQYKTSLHEQLDKLEDRFNTLTGNTRLPTPPPLMTDIDDNSSGNLQQTNTSLTPSPLSQERDLTEVTGQPKSSYSP